MPQTLPQRRPLRRAGRLCLAALVALTACSGDDFDMAQVPRITITPVIAVPLVTIAWTPAGAQQVVVYRGTVADGSAANIVWSVTGTGTNGLSSPVEYGTTPANGVRDVAPQRLLPGQPYTVQVSRVDPNNPGGSVSGSTYRYQSTQTFTLATSPP